MSVGIKIPDIRIKGFNEEWVERELGAVAEIKTGPFGSSLHAEAYVEYGHAIITTEHFKSGELPIDKKGIPQVCDEDYLRLKAYLLKTGDIVFSRVGSVDINAHVTDQQDGWLFSGRVLRVRSNDSIDSEYLHHELSTSRVRKSVVSRAVGQTMPSINTEILKITPIHYPVDKTEQTAIGTYFQKLDNLIKHHQQKHDKLSNIKKAMLEKMFPKQGETIPEIRFKGFSGEWEESSLAEEAVVTTGYPFDSADFSEDGDLLVVTNGNIQNSSSAVDGKVGNRIASEKVTHLNQYKLNFGDILVTMDGSVGRTAKVIDRNQILAQRVGRLVARNDTEFLYQSLNTGAFLETMTTISHGGTIKHISLSEIGSYIVHVPKDLNEQAKIGAYLKKLDDLIERHHKQITKLNNIKQACLSKMFV